MSCLMGAAGADAEYLRAWLGRMGHAAAAEPLEARQPVWPHALALVNPMGATGGAASCNGVHAAYVGAFHDPLPPGEPPVDLGDPAAVSRWLVDRYRRTGDRFLDGVIGHYAVALSDAARSQLLLAADPYGARKLFVHEEAGRFTFSSSLAALARVPPAGLPLDRSLEDFLLGFEFLPWERTPVAGVKYLRRGTLMRVSARGVTWQRIAAREFDAALAEGDRSEEPLADALDDALHASALDQAPPGRRIGVLLGGVDSALVAAYLARAGREVETFTFRFDDGRYNQAFCDELAEMLGIRHHWVPITPEVIRDGLRTYSSVFNQVSAIPHYVIQTAHACRVMAERGITRCLTGDGCDEIFLGYPSVYRRARLFMRLPSLPRPALRVAEAALAAPMVEDSAGHVARFCRNYLHILGRPWPVRGHISSRIFDEFSLRRLRRGAGPPQDADPEQVLASLADGLEALSPLRLAYHGKASVGLNKIKMEGSACASGVTLLSPYQHPRMTALASALPDAMLRRGGDQMTAATGKYIFFRMIERKGRLPRHMIYQKKASPVNAPVDYWYLGRLRPFVLETLGDLPFPYDAAYVGKMLTMKQAEEWFRSNVSLARSVFHPVALLATYANLHRTIRSASA